MAKEMKKIYIDLYKAPIYYLTNVPEEIAKKRFSHFGFNPHWHGSVGKSMSCEFENGNIIYGCYLKDKKDFAVLAHEALHIAFFIFQDRGIKFDIENSEPLNYLVEYIVTQFLK